MTNRCKLCGEPMPQGEEMFLYHGHSGPCPKPQIPRPLPVRHFTRAEIERHIAIMTAILYEGKDSDLVADTRYAMMIAAIRETCRLLDVQATFDE